MAGWLAAEVLCRAEGSADQRPLRFRIDENWYPVDELLDERLESGREANSARLRLFRVTSGGQEFLLRVELGGWLWTVRRVERG